MTEHKFEPGWYSIRVRSQEGYGSELATAWGKLLKQDNDFYIVAFRSPKLKDFHGMLAMTRDEYPSLKQVTAKQMPLEIRRKVVEWELAQATGGQT